MELHGIKRGVVQEISSIRLHLQFESLGPGVVWTEGLLAPVPPVAVGRGLDLRLDRAGSKGLVVDRGSRAEGDNQYWELGR